MIKLKQLISAKYFLRWIFLFLFIAIPLFGGASTKEAFFGSISDAFLEVSVFVALTLFIFYGLETWFKIDTEKLLKKYKSYQIPISALMGALPGCGGAIMVMTQYSMGRLGFGSVIAVLSSTMGDAAFLLLAQRPEMALQVFGISVVVGIIFGYLVEKIHGYDFLRKSNPIDYKSVGEFITYGFTKYPWLVMLIPGTIIGFFMAFEKQYIIDDFFAQYGILNFNYWYGVIGGTLSVLLWFINVTAGTLKSNLYICKKTGDIYDKLTSETTFVTTLVIFGYLVFDLGILWTGYNLENLFVNIQYLLPLIGVLIGFLPGCGPQIIVTSLYLQGVVPFSVQLGNSISNDGDALFPAIAMAPKVSIIATLYTAIPALIVSYLYMFLFEI